MFTIIIAASIIITAILTYASVQLHKILYHTRNLDNHYELMSRTFLTIQLENSEAKRDLNELLIYVYTGTLPDRRTYAKQVYEREVNK